MEGEPPPICYPSILSLCQKFDLKEAVFQPITLCTPIELMEEIQMKETPEK